MKYLTLPELTVQAEALGGRIIEREDGTYVLTDGDDYVPGLSLEQIPAELDRWRAADTEDFPESFELVLNHRAAGTRQE